MCLRRACRNWRTGKVARSLVARVRCCIQALFRQQPAAMAAVVPRSTTQAACDCPGPPSRWSPLPRLWRRCRRSLRASLSSLQRRRNSGWMRPPRWAQRCSSHLLSSTKVSVVRLAAVTRRFRGLTAHVPSVRADEAPTPSSVSKRQRREVPATAAPVPFVLPTLDEEPGAAAFPPPAAAEQIALMPAEPAHVHPSTPQQGPLQRRTSAPY